MLQEGTAPISVRPYHYPHHHKTKIERQVNEMLQQGIICHSSSLFSSHVILLKKKDDTWRMCVDYRALNKATVQYKFSILVVDLKSGYHHIHMKEQDFEKSRFSDA